MIWGPHPKYGTYIIYWFNFETGMCRISIVYFRPPFLFVVETSWSQVFKWPPTWLPTFPTFPKKKPLVFLGFSKHRGFDGWGSTITITTKQRVTCEGFWPFQIPASSRWAQCHWTCPFEEAPDFSTGYFCSRKTIREIKHKRNRVKVKGIGQKMIDQYTWILIDALKAWRWM